MTTQWLEGDIKSDEGYRADSYPDPLTGGAPYTIGYGHTGPDVKPHDVWTAARCEATFESDLKFIIEGLDAMMPWWRDMSDARQDVMVNAAFNMGVTGLSMFHHALTAMKAHDWPTAAAELLDSKWATQVPRRAKRLAQQMLTGKRVAP